MKTTTMRTTILALLCFAILGFTDCGQRQQNEVEKASYEPGEPAHDFTFADQDGNLVSMGDFKGKVVLIDVWATWCQPCLAQIPHLKKLEKEMEGKDFAIISISLDTDEAKEIWQKMIKQLGLGGTQLFAASGKEDFSQHYEIRGIPRFILIDKAGKIITAFAPMPSSKDEMQELIKNALDSKY